MRHLLASQSSTRKNPNELLWPTQYNSQIHDTEIRLEVARAGEQESGVDGKWVFRGDRVPVGRVAVTVA